MLSPTSLSITQKGKWCFATCRVCEKKEKYDITDPAILSKKIGQFGLNDCGPRFLESWMFHHKCNSFCSSSWLNIKTAPKTTVKLKKDTTYLWQTEQVDEEKAPGGKVA